MRHALSEDRYAKWCESIDYINKQSVDLSKTKHKAMEIMTKELRNIFQSHFEKDVSIIFKENCQIIEIEIPMYCEESVAITKELLDDLLMPTRVRYSNERCLVFELYPALSESSDDGRTEFTTISDILNEEKQD